MISTWHGKLYMYGLNIEISFLLVGHIKFALDWCFGMLKQVLKVISWVPE